MERGDGAELQCLVVVPFYADLGLLRQTLDSLMAQDDPDWVAVVIDDSPWPADVALEVAALVDGYGDVRLQRERSRDNLGVARTFNRAFAIALERGVDVVTILHADDLLEPNYIATVRAAHAAHPQAVCVAPMVTVIDADGVPTMPLADRVKALMWPRRLGELRGERGLALLLRGQFFYCPAVSYRVSAVRDGVVPRWNDQWGQVMDLELYARTLLAGGSIVLCKQRVYRYRRHRASATERNSVTLLRSEEETALCRGLVVEARQRGWHRAARAGRRRVAVRGQAALRALALARARQWPAARRAARLALAP